MVAFGGFSSLTRERRCNNPLPESGGMNCIGPNVDEKQCSTNDCVTGLYFNIPQAT